jgi:flagellar biosynthesis protein FlhB
MKDIEKSWPIISVLSFLGAVFVISFYFAYYKTGSWKFVHTPLEKLDERELKIAGSTSRISYAVFTVVALLVMLVLSLTELQINVVFTAVFIYFAHILPATIYLIISNRSDILSK